MARTTGVRSRRAHAAANSASGAAAMTGHGSGATVSQYAATNGARATSMPGRDGGGVTLPSGRSSSGRRRPIANAAAYTSGAHHAMFHIAGWV
jgi:hypothetical protein